MHVHLGAGDFAIIISYFLVVPSIGFAFKGKKKTSSDFLLSRRNASHWVTGIAFMPANLGALALMGMVANGAKYGMRTNHRYWIGAIPAMVFLGTFMVRFHYAINIRSVPKHPRMRFDR